MKRFIARSQGNLEIVWNVLDVKTSTFVRFGMTGRSARAEAIKLARKLNNDKRRAK